MDEVWDARAVRMPFSVADSIQVSDASVFTNAWTELGVRSTSDVEAFFDALEQGVLTAGLAAKRGVPLLATFQRTCISSSTETGNQRIQQHVWFPVQCVVQEING